MIVFTADNGYSYFRHRVPAKGAPYKECINVPFFVRGPEAPSGAVLSHMVSNLDLAPTICEWTDTPPPEGIDGTSSPRCCGTRASRGGRISL